MSAAHFKSVLKEVPRLFALMDKNKHSPTFGCFDRKYWKYKITDYANARMQEACYTLALLYSKRFDKNFYKNEEIKKYAKASIEFWTKIQNRDGSFNEYMPNEHSHVATAFSTFCVASTCKILGIEDGNFMEALKKAGKWLGKNDDLIVTNHDAGSVAALYQIYELTGDKLFLKYCKEKLKRVLGSQNSEGWFPEYGSADIGYLSLSIYYLAKYFQASGDKLVLKPLSKATEFISYFIHPDFSIGGNYGSRETNLLAPSGFMVLKDPVAKTVGKNVEKSIEMKRAAGPYCFDDRFVANSLYLYLDYANISEIVKGGIELPKDSKPFEKYFENSGLWVKKTPRFYMVVNTRKGGVMSIFNDKSLIYKDTGWVKKTGGKIMTTNGPSNSIVDKNVLINGNFYLPNFDYQTPSTLLSLRFLNSMGIHNVVKSVMRKRMILKNKKSRVNFKRRITTEKNLIKIEDFFEPAIGNISLTNNFSCIYSTSTGLYEDGTVYEVGVEKPVTCVEIIIKPNGEKNLSYK